jgi:acyl-CoA thioesterase
MKKVFAILLLCIAISIPAWAETESAKEKQTPQESQTTPDQMAMDKTIKQLKDQVSAMAQMCPKVMNQMDGMLSAIKDMAKMQEKILMGSKDEERKQEWLKYRITERIDELMKMMDQIMGKSKEAD